MKARKRVHFILTLLLAFSLLFGSVLPVYAGENDVLSEVRELIRNNYVDPVPENVLQAATVKEMIARLGDRNTQYLKGAEYDDFIGTLNRSFSGIGIELEMVPEGVKVTRVMDGYGAAKAGLKPGDIITQADGFSFAGKSSEYCIAKLKGQAGTKVKTKVKRGSMILNVTIERMQIELPLVESKLLEGHIGYIAVYSFGTDTAAQFGENMKSLREKGADSWIIDLRSNGGGYTQTAFEMLGYFIGQEIALNVKSRSQNLAYTAVEQDAKLTGPVILLTDNYTASASEIVIGAIKDYSKATILGETTYGSGRVKAIIPLTNGDYLKLSIQRFYTPANNSIDGTGIKPHVDLTGFDELEMATLLLRSQNLPVAGAASADKSGYLQLSAGPNNFVLALSDLRRAENWRLSQKIFDTVYQSTTMKLGGINGWEAFPEEYLQERYRLLYPGYADSGNLKNIPLDKKFTVTFGQDMDWSSVSADAIELINAGSGERVKCNFVFTGSRVMKVNPVAPLKASTEYWVVIHPTIKTADGVNTIGGLAVAKTAAK